MMICSLIAYSATAMARPVMPADPPKLGRYLYEVPVHFRPNGDPLMETITDLTLAKSSKATLNSITGKYYADKSSEDKTGVTGTVTITGSLYVASNKVKGIARTTIQKGGKAKEWIVEGDYLPATKAFSLSLCERTPKGTRVIQRLWCRHISEKDKKWERQATVIEGSWRHKTDNIGGSTWEVKDEGNGYFSAKESGLGGVKATAVRWSGGTLRIEFDEPRGWAGFYEWKIPEFTTKGEGHLTITRGRVGTYTSIVEKV